MLIDNDVMFVGIDVIFMLRVEFDIVLYIMVVVYVIWRKKEFLFKDWMLMWLFFLIIFMRKLIFYS